MANKYKLKQWYPSLPNWMEEGDIVTKNSLDLYRTVDGYYVSEKEVEDNPEFWEKVEPKNYEILSVKAVKGSTAGKIYTDIKKHLDYYVRQIEKGRDEIHSVKRLSDGEVFTVGDKVGTVHAHENYVIKSFELKHNNSRVVAHTSWEIENPNGQLLMDLIPVKPLFTTVDGVEIYQGDRYCFVTDDYSYHIGVAPDEIDENYGSSVISRLSSSKMAQEWIMENRPRYSRADLQRAIDERVHEIFVSRMGTIPVDKNTGEKWNKKMYRQLTEKMDKY